MACRQRAGISHALCTPIIRIWCQSLKPTAFLNLMHPKFAAIAVDAVVAYSCMTVHGYSSELCKGSRPVPQIMIFVFPALTLNLFFSMAFYTLPLKCGEVLCYTLRCPSIRPCSPFPIDNLSIYSRNFFKFCIHIVISDEWYGIVNGQNPSIFNGVTALFGIGKMVSGLLFLYRS